MTSPGFAATVEVPTNPRSNPMSKTSAALTLTLVQPFSCRVSERGGRVVITADTLESSTVELSFAAAEFTGFAPVLFAALTKVQQRQQAKVAATGQAFMSAYPTERVTFHPMPDGEVLALGFRLVGAAMDLWLAVPRKFLERLPEALRAMRPKKPS